MWVVFISIVLGSYDGFKPAKTILALIGILGLWYVVAERKRFLGPQWGAPAPEVESVSPMATVQSEKPD